MFVEVVLTIASIIGIVIMYMEEINIIAVTLKGKIIMYFLDVKKQQEKNLYYMPKGIKEIIKRIIAVTTGIDSKGVIYLFWAVTIGPPIVVAIILNRYLSEVMLALVMMLLASIPLILLIVKLTNMRIKSSKEGKILLVELLDNYKINYYNMQQAIEITAETIEEAPNTRKLLFNLSKGINRARNKEEIRGLLDNFKYAIGTSWAGILADNIYFALSAGIRVEKAMEDLIRTIAMAEEIEEHAKRENNEAGLILKYLIPICYLLSIIGGIEFFDITIDKFFYYQFQTVIGITWFVAIMSLYIISIVARFFLTQNKLDL